MRDVDLAISIAHVGGVDPETSHSTIQMRKAILEFTLPLFKLNNVSLNDNFAIIKGNLADYSIHLGSGLVHQMTGAEIAISVVPSQHRGRLFYHLLMRILKQPKSSPKYCSLPKTMTSKTHLF